MTDLTPHTDAPGARTGDDGDAPGTSDRPLVDVLIPTFDRPAALAVTLAFLAGQTYRPFRVVVSDQGTAPARDSPEVLAVVRLLELRGIPVRLERALPRRGMAEHRQRLLDACEAPYAWFVDDDVMTEPGLLDRLVRALVDARCGFVGSFVEAPSAVGSDLAADAPSDALTLEFWDGPVVAEDAGPGTPGWERRHVHFAAFLRRIGTRDGLLDVSGRPTSGGDRLYKVAWVGGCVLYDVAELRAAGGFGFWHRLPAQHVGEDVAAQLAVQRRAGGAGLFPSGAWHMEVPTTLPQRDVDAPIVLGAGLAPDAGLVTGGRG